MTHHLHHLHLCIQAQVVEEHLKVLLHLDRVVIHLGHSEDSHLALPPHLQRGRQHQYHSQIVHCLIWRLLATFSTANSDFPSWAVGNAEKAVSASAAADSIIWGLWVVVLVWGHSCLVVGRRVTSQQGGHAADCTECVVLTVSIVPMTVWLLQVSVTIQPQLLEMLGFSRA